MGAVISHTLVGCVRLLESQLMSFVALCGCLPILEALLGIFVFGFRLLVEYLDLLRDFVVDLFGHLRLGDGRL